MRRKQVKHIINAHYRKLISLFKKIFPDFESEAIHQFRVEYKKLRAFLRMLSSHDTGAKKLIVSKKLQKCYQQLGFIRDLQLQQQRTRKINPPNRQEKQQYMVLLQKKINKLKSKFPKLFTAVVITKSKKKIAKLLSSSFPLKGFRNYVAEKWSAIHAMGALDEFSDENIHGLRKDLKDIFYNAALYRHLSLNIHIPKSLFTELGDFQDKCRALTLLTDPRLVARKRYSILPEHIKTTWIKQRQNSKRLLLQHIKKAITSNDNRLEKHMLSVLNDSI